MNEGIDNTSALYGPPGLHPSLVLGPDYGRRIEDMEAAGQRQLLNSDRLPTRILGDRAEFESLSFTFSDPDPDDPLFMPATLPDGWRREGSDHDMWSYIVDQDGNRRVAIFYKAAFYDRRAFMRLAVPEENAASIPNRKEDV